MHDQPLPTIQFCRNTSLKNHKLAIGFGLFYGFSATVLLFFALLGSVKPDKDLSIIGALYFMASLFLIITIIAAKGPIAAIKEHNKPFIMFSETGFWFYTARHELKWSQIGRVEITQMPGFSNIIVVIRLTPDSPVPKFSINKSQRQFNRSTKEIKLTISGGLLETTANELNATIQQYWQRYHA